MKRFVVGIGVVCAALGLGSSAHADYTTVNMSGLVNYYPWINPGSFPIGTTTGNEGTGIPFDTTTYDGVMGVWLADGGNRSDTGPSSLTINLTSLDIQGQSTFYALLNNFWGTPGVNEYDITITATDGDSVTYQSIGAVDTRDYNQNTSNTIADTTTPWFNNGEGQRLDVREFVLPSSFESETIASFTITQVDYSDPAMFSGLTFSTDSLAFGDVPEPATLGILGVGLSGVLAARRRRR